MVYVFDPREAPLPGCMSKAAFAPAPGEDFNEPGDQKQHGGGVEWETHLDAANSLSCPWGLYMQRIDAPPTEFCATAHEGCGGEKTPQVP